MIKFCHASQTFITSGAIAVNAEGVRFLNEDTYYDKSAADAITAQTGGVCYVILNQQIIDTVCVPGDNHLANDISMYEKGDTVEELAGKLGIDAQALAATLDGYSASVEAGRTRSSAVLNNTSPPPIARAPSTARKPCPNCTPTTAAW